MQTSFIVVSKADPNLVLWNVNDTITGRVGLFAPARCKEGLRRLRWDGRAAAEAFLAGLSPADRNHARVVARTLTPAAAAGPLNPTHPAKEQS
jgi:hypothetical protein